MKFIKPKNIENLYETLDDVGNQYLLAGGTDINVQIKNGTIRKPNIIYINHIQELTGIEENNDSILIGSTTSFKDIIESKSIKKYIPFMHNSLQNFASPLIQTTATIGGNIANGSPTADVIPILLALDAKLMICSKSTTREVFLKDFFTGYKQNVIMKNELITKILISKRAEHKYQTFYKKVGSRNSLAIAKVAVAGVKKVTKEKITDIKIAVGSLNEYPRRLFKVEEYVTGKTLIEIDFEKVEELLNLEITPISDLRSDKEYRYHVCVNLIRTFLNE
ncbi:MAG: xanthine dehydrogenase family protein subunit M [Candidatus Cloacimonetes bacterium]|jgi:CO/xanthine dehydrogenase FAD-binding subunit|nr:xanthine dehydrogenase family protein subunit M [Candidatus Cloacimonadota bacterium]